MREFDRCAITRQAAQRRRNAYGSAGVSADGGDRRTFLHSSGAAARRSASQPAWIARLDAVTVVRIFPGDSVGELMQVRLAHDERALRTQARGHGGISGGHGISHRVETRAAAGGKSAEIEAILERYGKAVKSGLLLRWKTFWQLCGLIADAVGVEREVDVVSEVTIGPL